MNCPLIGDSVTAEARSPAFCFDLLGAGALDAPYAVLEAATMDHWVRAPMGRRNRLVEKVFIHTANGAADLAAGRTRRKLQVAVAAAEERWKDDFLAHRMHAG
jgi:hypothetical protein